MKKYLSKIGVIIVTLGVFVSPGLLTTLEAQTCDLNQPKEELEKCLLEVNKQINKLTGDIVVENGTQQTLNGEINKLTGEIKKTTNEIGKKNTLIQNIKGDIVQKEQSLQGLNEKLRREKESLEKILRKRYELGDATLFEMLLSRENISAFYQDAPSFSYIQESLSDSFVIIDELKVNIYGEKISLEEKKTQEDTEKYGLQIEQKKIEVQKKQRDQALSVSEQKEAGLANLRKIREQEAAAIRNKLFELRDVVGGGIAFGTAYQYAKEAGIKTGVRPAFILAILQQESNLGKNVGTCNRNTNEPIWSEIMPGPTSGSWRDDQTIFKGLMAKLGRPLVGTPLSCPIKRNGSYSGWGGAMGPSQFIPATWKSYESRVANSVGAATADPWNARHAIHATALYVSDLGASAQTYESEKNAACKYYSGRGCSDPAVKNAFYGNGVMNRVISIQSNIDLIQ